MNCHNEPITCLITDGTLTPADFDLKKSCVLDAIKTAVDAGVSIIQIRERQITARMLFELTLEAVPIVKGAKALLFINDRADIAAAAGADGVHLTSTSLDSVEIRKAFGGYLLVGISTHTADEVLKAKEDGADYIVFGPVFPSPGKGEPVGLDALSAVCETAGNIPVLALGGIDNDNWRSAVSVGASGFAAIRLFAGFSDATELASALKV
ncbi:MAG TPA: thiamine phosphate synthase [Pyrinomonadaceae bacterium]|nr:thiamine phosphate synthase [Pyrinomonadaceae bacterium]